MLSSRKTNSLIAVSPNFGMFINFCVGRGKDVIIVLKNNYPSLIEDAKGPFKMAD